MAQQKDRNQKNFTLSEKQLAAFDQLKSKLEFEKDIKLFDYMLTATERQNAIIIAPGREDEVNDFNHYINAISKSYNSILESAINARSQAEADVARVLETREKTIANLQDQLNSAQEAQADAEKIAKDTQESCDAQLTREREKQALELKTLQDSSGQQINKLQADLESVQDECAGKDKLVESQVGEIASLKQQVADRDVMAKTAATFETMYNNVQDTLNETQTMMKSYRQQMGKMEDENAKLKKEIAAKDQEIATAKKDAEAAHRELEKIKKVKDTNPKC